MRFELINFDLEVFKGYLVNKHSIMVKWTNVDIIKFGCRDTKEDERDILPPQLKL